jgi:hypothetical protein
MTMLERDEVIDRRLVAYGAALESDIAKSGALGRVRGNVLRRSATDLFAGFSLQRIAAAILIAGVLGGVLDLALPVGGGDTLDVAAVDPFDPLEEADVQ